MKGLLAGVGIGLAIVAAVLAGARWWLDRQVQSALARRYDAPLAAVDVPHDAAAIAEGERLAWIYGCHGCHGEALQGRVFIDDPKVMRVVSPNIPAAISGYSDAELARLIRHGIRRDGTGVLAMPVTAAREMSDATVGRIIAHLRRVPNVRHALPATELRLLGKLAVRRGALRPEAAILDHGAPRLGNRSDTSATARGEYLARSICGECHGATLLGALEAPPLPSAMGYSLADFTSLLLDGRSRDGRELATMGRAARERFVRFTRDEIAVIHDYLMRMSIPPVAAGGAAAAAPGAARVR